MNASNERCPNCGSIINTPQARFCGSCGSPLPAAASEPQRGPQPPEQSQPEGSSEASGRAAPDLRSVGSDGLRLARKAARFVQDPIHLDVASPARWQVVVGDLPPSGPAALSALSQALKTEAGRAATSLSREKRKAADADDRASANSDNYPDSPDRPPTPPEAFGRPEHRGQAQRERDSAAPIRRPDRPSGPPERPSAPPEATRVGHTTATQGPRLAARATSAAEAREIIIVSGAGVGERYPLGPRSTIGRSKNNTIQLEDERSSRNHAVLVRSDEGLWLEDLGSTNGTQVNGQVIRQRVLVRPGDRVQIGNTVLQIVRSAQSAAAPAAAELMRCANCGGPIAPGSGFCGACGHRVV